MRNQKRYFIFFLFVLLFFIQRNVIFLSLMDYCQVLLKGEQVIVSNLVTWIISSLFFALGAFVCIMIFLNAQEELDIWGVISLGVSGSPILLSLLCLLIVSLRQFTVLIFIFSCCLIYYRDKKTNIVKNLAFKFSDILRLSKSYHYTREKLIWGIFFIILLINLFLIKFGYIDGLRFPLNTDSVNHTYQISNILATNDILKLPYYHCGFHYIIIVLSALTGATIPQTILIFGQLLQVMAPITLFYPVYRVTKNYKAAWITLFIVSFVWSMPSQVTSWGKYPTLLAMVTVVFVFYILKNILQPDKQNIGSLILSIIVFMIAVFIHSRMLIVITAGGITLLSFKLLKQKRISITDTPLWLFLNYALSVILLMLFPIVRVESWSLAFSPYLEIALLPLLLLLPFSIAYYFEYTIKIEIFILLCLLFTVTPFPEMDNFFHVKTLIDGPFLSILLFIPMSIILGLNFASLEQFLSNWFLKKNNMLLFLFMLLFMFYPNKKIFTPLPDVNFVTTNDLFLYDEIKNQMPADIKILIPYATPYYELGTDGGAWINYVTGRETIKSEYDIDLASYSMLVQICNTGARYIYLGNKPYSFSTNVIMEQKYWYSPLIYYPDVKLYKIIGCSLN